MNVKCDYCTAAVINGVPSHESGCTGHFTFENEFGTFVKFRIWSLDVWGNSRDGFEVNDRSERGVIRINTAFQYDDKHVINRLKDEGFLNKRVRTYRIDGDELNFDVEHPKYGPLLQLEII